MLTEFLIGERRKLIVDYCNVMLVAQAISMAKYNGRKSAFTNVRFGQCGWPNDPSKWYIHFDMTNKQWRKFIDILERSEHSIVLTRNGKLYLV